MTELEQKILKTIAARQLTPKPAYTFLARRSVFWALAAVSIILGGISFAIVMFAVSDYFATSWRVLDNIHLNELLLVIPAVWLLLIGAFTASAVYGLRQTRRGYRFRPAAVTALALGLSLAIGGALHAADAGRALHEMMAANFKAYRDFTYVPFAEWSRPDEGYLGGTVIGMENGQIHLRDFHDRIWIVDVGTARIELDESPQDEGDIAITGRRTGPDTFQAATISEFD